MDQEKLANVSGIVMDLFTALIELVLIGLMCAGLLIATVFRFYDLIDGGQWVQVCSVLYGAGGLSVAIANGLAGRRST